MDSLLMYILIGLTGFSSCLFILSFFMRDRTKKLEEDLEQLSLSLMQDTYQLKRKIRVLEEEFLIVSGGSPTLYFGDDKDE